jgi:hypothetical protein
MLSLLFPTDTKSHPLPPVKMEITTPLPRLIQSGQGFWLLELGAICGLQLYSAVIGCWLLEVAHSISHFEIFISSKVADNADKFDTILVWQRFRLVSDSTDNFTDRFDRITI